MVYIFQRNALASRLRSGLAWVAAIMAVLALPQPAGAQAADTQASSGEGLRAFRSDSELIRFLNRIRERQQERYEEYGPPPPPAPPPPMVAAAPSFEASAAEDDGITNNQTAGVDEGGIVKARGDLLIVLRRGRLFTISTAGGGMRAIDTIDAFPPETQGGGAWYDEMLIAGNRVIVIGFSYTRGGTEINRFRLSDDGRLSFEDSHHLRSNDYYSADNYSSRLIGNSLIFYTPLSLMRTEEPLDALPGVKRWDGDPQNRVFQRIAGPRQIYIADDLFRSRPEGASTLHSVTTCDISSPDFDCTATGVIAAYSSEFYVSGDAIYLWVVDRYDFTRSDQQGFSHIYRLPLDGTRPSSIGARGAPADQFSFREDAAEGMLNVLVRAGSGNTAMWEPQAPTGTVSLIRVPLTEFGDGSSEVRQRYYRHLTRFEGYAQLENRFVGDHLIFGYGRTRSWQTPPQYDLQPVAFAVPLSGAAIAQFNPGHSVERIEPMGSDAVIVGSDLENQLGFSPIELNGGLPALGEAYVMPAAGQGESRSHAYFYRPDPDSADGASGTLGLPIARTVQSEYARLFGNAASMLFLRRDDRQFSRAGELGAEIEGAVDDNCQASCVDWYGNARPIFLRDRIFALLGYELVEGRMDGGQISEIGRLDYAPKPGSPPN